MSENKQPPRERLSGADYNDFAARAHTLLPVKRCRISASALGELRKALTDYAAYIAESQLTLSAGRNYVTPVNNFFRWLVYDYDPGCRVDPKPLREKKEGPKSVLRPATAHLQNEPNSPK